MAAGIYLYGYIFRQMQLNIWMNMDGRGRGARGAQVLSEAVWQRVWAARTDAGLRAGGAAAGVAIVGCGPACRYHPLPRLAPTPNSNNRSGRRAP